MPSSDPTTTTAPEFTVIGSGEPTDAAIAALARLLLALVEQAQEAMAEEAE